MTASSSRSFRTDVTFGLQDAVVVGFLSVATGLVADDWIGGAAAAVLWFVWRYLRKEGGVPVLAAALTFQWMQVTIGIWYFAATGRKIATMNLSDYRPMVLIGLGCVASIAVGLRAGISIMRRSHPDNEHDLSIPIAWSTLLWAYVFTTAAQGVLQQLAYQAPGLTQPILALRFIRLAVLFLVIRRVGRPVMQWQWIVPIVLFEVVLGVTGYFAGFREPLVMIAMALYDAFNPRLALHWAFSAGLGALALTLSVMWMTVRVDYRASFEDENFAESRQAQVDKMMTLATSWWHDEHDASEMDHLIDRLWTVYYPALAVSRVPSVLPHTDGALLSQALQHVFNPRLFFPTKGELQSESEMVRKYSGVRVAGAEQNTSIAFGYAAEAYLDFGLPWMFLPILIYGLLMGAAYHYLSVHIAHAELRAGLLACVFWLSLYLFERSWAKTFGLAGTLLIYLGGPALVLDHYLSKWSQRSSVAVPGDRRPAPPLPAR